MAKVIRNIEITEEEVQILLKVCGLINSLTEELEITSASFFDELNDIFIYDGQNLNGKTIRDDYAEYEFKIVDK